MAPELFSLPDPASLPRRPRGIVLHWTGGAWRSSSHDREHYHALIEFDDRELIGRPEAPNRRVVAGVPIINNMQPTSRAKIYRLDQEHGYAPHTKNFNSYRIAYAVCGMLNARHRHELGDFPIMPWQIDDAITLSAQTLAAFEMPVSPQTLCTHYEVHTIHGVAQNRWDDPSRPSEKWDITWIPNRPELGPDDVGPWLRSEVEARLAA